MAKKSKKEEELETKIKELEKEIEHLNRLVNEKDSWISYLQNQVIIKLDQIFIPECDHIWNYYYNTTAPHKVCVKCNRYEPIVYNNIVTNTTSPTF